MSYPLHRIYAVRARWLKNLPLIGRLSVPILQDSRTGTSSKSVGSEQPTLQNPVHTRFVPAFQYESDWLKNGFPIGADLVFDRSIQTPPPGKRLFGFMSDRALSPRIASSLSSYEVKDLRLKSDATPEETATLILPNPSDAFGGLLFEEEKEKGNISLSRLSATQAKMLAKLRSRIRRTSEFDETLYAFHAAERGKAGPSDIEYLRRAFTLPGRAPVLTVHRNNEVQTARLRSVNDPIDRPLWLYIALLMAADCGIPVAASAIEREMGETVLFQKRVDRDAAGLPRPVFTAATLVNTRKAGSVRPAPFSYLAMADILNRDGAAPAEDLPLIWKRIVYRLMTGGASADTPRTWLFVREALGLRLLPAHTLEWISPTFAGFLTGAESHMLPFFNRAAKGITIDGRRSLSHPEDALEFAPYFGLSPSEAKMTLMTMMRTMSGWENRAYEFDADPNDIALMAPIFDEL